MNLCLLRQNGFSDVKIFFLSCSRGINSFWLCPDVHSALTTSCFWKILIRFQNYIVQLPHNKGLTFYCFFFWYWVIMPQVSYTSGSLQTSTLFPCFWFMYRSFCHLIFPTNCLRYPVEDSFVPDSLSYIIKVQQRVFVKNTVNLSVLLLFNSTFFQYHVKNKNPLYQYFRTTR